MRYDALVVGAGLAGLACATRLSEEGRRVLVVAKGVGGLHLSAGTIDVLGYRPQLVESPRQELDAFAAAHPGHPYALLGISAVEEGVAWLRRRVSGLVGDLDANLRLPTAVGVAKPSALAPASIAAGDLRGGGRFVFAGFRGLKDFYPGLLADNLRLSGLPGIEVRALELAATPRRGVADIGTMPLARALDTPGFRRLLADELRPQVEPGETVALPAVLGLERADEAWRDLQELLGAPVAEVPTLPPSLPGIRLSRHLTATLRRLGGRLLVGPEAIGGEVEGGRLTGVVVSESGRRRVYRAPAVVLASGGFASGGIELDSRGRLRETVFDLPLTGLPADGRGTSPRYLDPQPLLRAGVAVDAELRPVDGEGGVIHENLWAVGDVLAGAAPWREKSGEGICLASAVRAAASICEWGGEGVRSEAHARLP